MARCDYFHLGIGWEARSRRQVPGVAHLELGPNRLPKYGHDLGPPVVELAASDRRREGGLVGDTEPGQCRPVGLGLGRARGQPALDPFQGVDGDACVELDAALGRRHDVALEKLTDRFNQLGGGRNVVRFAQPAPAAATRAAAIPCIPNRFGWTGAAGDEGTAGSTQRITGGWQASWPMLAA